MAYRLPCRLSGSARNDADQVACILYFVYLCGEARVCVYAVHMPQVWNSLLLLPMHLFKLGAGR